MIFYVKINNEELVLIFLGNYFYVNVIEWNRGVILLLEGKFGFYLSVKVISNYFFMNLVIDLNGNRYSVCNIFNLVVYLVGNFFYNNSG